MKVFFQLNQIGKTIAFIALICLPLQIFCEDETFLKFSLDKGKWKRAFQNSNLQADLVEFTLKDENVDHWSELVTLQKIPSIGTIEEYYQNFINNLKKTVGRDHVQSKVIKKGTNSIFFEWWIYNSPLAQHEWFKLIKGPHSTFILRYTTKKLDQVEKIRPHWEKILNQASLSKKNP